MGCSVRAQPSVVLPTAATVLDGREQQILAVRSVIQAACLSVWYFSLVPDRGDGSAR